MISPRGYVNEYINSFCSTDNLMPSDYTFQDVVDAYMILSNYTNSNKLAAELSSYNNPIVDKLNRVLLKQGVESSEMLFEQSNRIWTLMTLSFCQYLAYLVWDNTYRTVYNFDRNFVKHFSNTDKLRIYPSNLYYLPCNVFYISFDNLEITKFNEDFGAIVTVSPVYNETTNYGFDIYISILSNKVITDPMNISISFKECNYENGILYYDYRKQYKYGDVKIRSLDDKDMVNHSAQDEEIMLILQFLAYMTCDKPDIMTDKVTRRQEERAKRIGKEYKGEKCYLVGTHYGKAISLLEKEIEKKVSDIDTSSNSRSHSSPRPHLVSAHWHGYWCGKGKKQFEYRWIAPYIQGIGELDVVLHNCIESNVPKYSHGEQILYAILGNLGVEFQPQYRVASIDRIFDCSITIKNQIGFIEFDGEQHFHQVSNWDFEKTCSSDREKTNWCYTKGYPLLRIRYDQICDMYSLVKIFMENFEEYTSHFNPIFTDENYYKCI